MVQARSRRTNNLNWRNQERKNTFMVIFNLFKILVVLLKFLLIWNLFKKHLNYKNIIYL